MFQNNIIRRFFLHRVNNEILNTKFFCSFKTRTTGEPAKTKFIDLAAKRAVRPYEAIF
jgi:hypothetical protein